MLNSATPEATLPEVELSSLKPYMYPEGWIQVPVTRNGTQAPDFHLPHDAYVVDDHAYAYVPGVYQDGTVQEPLYYAPRLEPTVDDSASPLEGLSFQFTDGAEPLPFFLSPEGSMVPLETRVQSGGGPFLSDGSTPISPTDAEWTLQPAQVNTAERNGRYRSDESEGSAQNSVPRHISMSSFPTAPESMHKSSPYATTWTDRATSHAFAGGLAGPLQLEVGEDLMVWDDGTEEDAGEGRQSTSVTTP